MSLVWDMFIGEQRWVSRDVWGSGYMGLGVASIEESEGHGSGLREGPGQGRSLAPLKIQQMGCLTWSAYNKCKNLPLWSKEMDKMLPSRKNGISSGFFPIASCLVPSQMAPASQGSQLHPSLSACPPR